MLLAIYKESVELTSVYLIEGCGKTLIAIKDTIPHTRIDMGVRVRRTRPATGIYANVSVVPYLIAAEWMYHPYHFEMYQS